MASPRVPWGKLHAVRCKPWGALGCPSSLSKDMWGERPAVVPAQAGRALEVLVGLTGTCLAEGKHDCDCHSHLPVPGTEDRLLRKEFSYLSEHLQFGPGWGKGGFCSWSSRASPCTLSFATPSHRLGQGGRERCPVQVLYRCQFRCYGGVNLLNLHLHPGLSDSKSLLFLPHAPLNSNEPYFPSINSEKVMSPHTQLAPGNERRGCHLPPDVCLILPR